MKLLVNPNTSASVTARIGAAAAAETETVAVNPESGPASIEGYFDEAFAVPIDTGVASALPAVGAAHGLERAHKPVTSSSRRAASRSKL
jgi:Asp/Glu/hydantoin racemase